MNARNPHVTAFESPLVVASNRGPVSFVRTDSGELSGDRGPGGLVTALAGVLFESDATWLAVAVSDEDRALAASGRAIEVDPSGRAAFVDVAPSVYDGYYNGVSNRVLWLLHHYLFDLAYLPAWDHNTRAIWEDYRAVNRQIAEALDRERDRQPVYLVQDYHLSMVPGFLRELNPSARIAHFTHTPFASASYLRLLPAAMRDDLLRGMLGADVLGFQSPQWAENFLIGVRNSLPDVRVDVRRQRIHVGDRTVLVRAYPVSLDPAVLRSVAKTPEVKAIRREIGAWRGEGKLLLRVDRLELSKNIVRGFQAYEEFLRDDPSWQGKVKFLCLLPRSRSEIPEYQVYSERCLDAAEEINAKLGGDGWDPVEIRTEENYPQAVAAFGLYDALLVNPVFDGMNLVAMEGPLVNRNHGSLILSRNAGAFASLGRHAVAVNPFDIAETAEAIGTALDMPEDQRVRHARGLTRAVLARNPVRWLTAQLRDLDLARGISAAESQAAQEHEERLRSGHDDVGGEDELLGRS